MLAAASPFVNSRISKIGSRARVRNFHALGNAKNSRIELEIARMKIAGLRLQIISALFSHLILRRITKAVDRTVFNWKCLVLCGCNKLAFILVPEKAVHKAEKSCYGKNNEEIK